MVKVAKMSRYAPLKQILNKKCNIKVSETISEKANKIKEQLDTKTFDIFSSKANNVIPVVVDENYFESKAPKKNKFKKLKNFFSKGGTCAKLISVGAIALGSMFAYKSMDKTFAEELYGENYRICHVNSSNKSVESEKTVYYNDSVALNDIKSSSSVSGSENKVSLSQNNERDYRLQNNIYRVKKGENYWKIAENFVKDNLQDKYNSLSRSLRETLVGKVWSTLCDDNVPLNYDINSEVDEFIDELDGQNSYTCEELLNNNNEADPYLLKPGQVIELNTAKLDSIIRANI
ncbi:LysM peptidoglycan-binding domain-containing protein [bacterium]|nr:LysM peptidoglycan-binding domain-containing protein [bacterium]